MPSDLRQYQRGERVAAVAQATTRVTVRQVGDSVDRRDALRWIGAGTIGVLAVACGTDSRQARRPRISKPTNSASRSTARTPAPAPGSTTTRQPPTNAETEAQVLARFEGQMPTQWGTNVSGVNTRLDTTEPVMALSFDACGGIHGSGVDQALIDLLNHEDLPATLFLNERWIDANPQVTDSLIANPLFEIANHGTHHRPLSVTGRSAYGITGCTSPAEVIDEVESNWARLAALLGHPLPKFFRSGTAYYDEIGAAIVTALGETPVSFATNGDAGGTFSVAQIGRALGEPPPGTIVLMHMNQPGRSTARGLAAALPALRTRGTRFVTLSGANLPVVQVRQRGRDDRA